MLRCTLICVFTFLYSTLSAQQVIKGKVTDATSKTPIPFATIKIGNTSQGAIADLDGKFIITIADNIPYIEISCLGYQPKRISLPTTEPELKIALKPKEGTLHEVVIQPPYKKIYRILNMAIQNRDKNNPDKYDWYQCKVYYKMICDIAIPNSSKIMKDTSEDARSLREFMADQHLLISETYSKRTWKKPQQLQEDVLGSRLSGFKKSMFTSLVTNTLPFHSYSDYLTLNGKDYHNPISKGFIERYNFNLNDELLQGKDTVWIISFRPKASFDELSGQVYINSDGYAIAYLRATAQNKGLQHFVRIEQEYTKTSGRWFPNKLNYIIDWKMQQDGVPYTLIMKGNSNVDSVSFTEDKSFRFDKAHTVRLEQGADELNDVSWYALRPTSLNSKEARTYEFMDSIGDKAHLDNIISYIRKLPEGKLPIGPVDIDLTRIYTYNKYESNRLGLGLQTNEKVIKWLSVGGWAGYGFGDKHWKYGAFAEAYADRYKEFVFRLAYDNYLRDPGRISLNHDLDNNYLRAYLMNRVDQVSAVSASVKKRIGYWNAELSVCREDITPMYAYTFQYEGGLYKEFTAKEVSLNLRYAFAERTAPVFGYYYSLGSKYPVWYGKITRGQLESGAMQTTYTQALSAISWHKHINKIGFEHFLVEGGKIWSSNSLPISKLFAGNGYAYDASISLYGFGGLLTAYPYEFYTDQFFNFIWKHDFDWKIYKLERANWPLSSAPSFSIGYGYLYGTLNHPEVHKDVAIAIPYNGYHETGIILDNLVRLKYMSLYYITLNIGYYYHWAPVFDLNSNGRFVAGIGVEL